jgi:WhiB family transcriptional regulator, redox-sensing transcriptional regulator
VSTEFALIPFWNLPGTLSNSAECRFDPELHTGPDAFEQEDQADREVREDVAKQICAGCPVQLACLDYAIQTLPEHGIWSGLTAHEISDLAALTELGDVA